MERPVARSRGDQGVILFLVPMGRVELPRPQGALRSERSLSTKFQHIGLIDFLHNFFI